MYDRSVSRRRDRQGRPTLPEAFDASSFLPRGEGELPVLVVLTGKQLGQRIRLEQPAVIGRDPEADLMLTDREVAWHHCRVELQGARWVVVDLSGEGQRTEVNGERIVERALSPEDQIIVGATVVRFELHDPVEQAYDDAVLERLNKDELTGLLARRAFDAQVASELIAAARRDETVGAIVLDVDRLKEINDEHGHLAGAAVIAAVGGAIGEGLPEDALACRLGGDEFAVAVPGIDREATLTLAEQLRARVLAMTVEYEGVTLTARVSVGVAEFPTDGDMANALLRAADLAMYEAKRAGGDRVSCAPRDDTRDPV